MSKKDVDDYFNQVTSDYHELIETLRDAEQEVSSGLLNPDNLVLLKQQVENAKVNWERISYIMFLFNRPTKKSKQNKYENQNRKYVTKDSTLSAVHKENLDNIRKIKSALRTS